LATGTSRPSALLVVYILPVCALLAPGRSGAAAPKDGNVNVTSVLKSALQNYDTASTTEASRLAALLVGCGLPACSLLAPGDPSASAPDAAP
jgi:hypothetical protein